MSEQLSRYMPELVELAMRVKAKAAYVFFIDGDRGTGGSPIVMDAPLLERDEYERRCRTLVNMLRRSADLLEGDLRRQGFR